MDSWEKMVNNFFDLRLVMVLNQAVQEKFKDSPPEITAAVFLAMTEKNRNDLVEQPEGIYMSYRCWERILLYEVWLTDEGEIIITRKSLSGKPDEPKEESQNYLKRHLPKARNLGRMNSLHYAIGLALTFGLDQNRLILKNGEVGIYY